MSLLLIAAGGAVGSLSRYALDRAVSAILGPSFLGIMFVNVTGAFLLGVFVSAFDSHGWPASVRTLVAVGFLGSYTTFSTLMAASVELAQSGEFARAALNIGGSVLLGLAAALAGILIGRAL